MNLVHWIWNHTVWYPTVWHPIVPVLLLDPKTGPVTTFVDVFEDVFAGLDVSADLHIDVSIIHGQKIGAVGHHPAVLLTLIVWHLIPSRLTLTVFGVAKVWFEDNMIAELLRELLGACFLFWVPARGRSTCSARGVLTAVAMEHAPGHRGIEIWIETLIGDLSTDSSIYFSGAEESILRM